MDCAAGSSTQHIAEYVSLEDVLRFFYFYGLTSLSLWCSSLEKIKDDIYKAENVDLFELYIKLVDLMKKIRIALELRLVNSQTDLLLLNDYLFDIDEVYNYLSENVQNFSNKIILKSTYASVHSLIRQIKPTSADEDDVDVDESMSSDESDEDEFNKIFSSLKDSKQEKKANIFQQTLMFQSNGTRKMLTTPGEKGGYLIKIEITDTRDLKGVPKNAGG